MQVKIKNDAFQGLVQFNNCVATLDTEKGTDKPVIGTTGLKRFQLAGGNGAVYLTESQYEELK